MASRRYTRDLLVKPTGLILKNDMISMRSPSSNAIIVDITRWCEDMDNFMKTIFGENNMTSSISSLGKIWKICDWIFSSKTFASI